ncbi:MAG TPA: cytochrome c3 family protein [Oscillospiraceae bacterium]|nr:cytochrome c3 family protein [Oscillospiraceae bacterium]
MNRNIFLVLALVVMAAFAWYVKGTVLVPAQTVAGPDLVSHRVDQYDEDCVDCHAKVGEWHKENFAAFSSDNCMDCHGGAPGTPHPTDGTYAECLTCHEPIVATHDEMFPYENTTYEDCVGCHIPE